MLCRCCCGPRIVIFVAMTFNNQHPDSYFMLGVDHIDIDVRLSDVRLSEKQIYLCGRVTVIKSTKKIENTFRARFRTCGAGAGQDHRKGGRTRKLKKLIFLWNKKLMALGIRQSRLVPEFGHIVACATILYHASHHQKFEHSLPNWR